MSGLMRYPQPLFALVFLLFCGLSCKKNNPEQATVEQKKDTLLNYANIPTLQELQPQALKQVANWEAYQEWERSFGFMERATTKEELLLAVEDLLEKQKDLDEKTAPKAFEVLPIQARQKVMKTHLLQLKAALEDETATDSSMHALYRARNAWRNQMNILLRSPLDSVMERAMFDPNEPQ